MRNRIFVLGTIVLDIILFFIGLFLLYWGAWGYLFGSRVGAILAPQMIGFGIFILIIGIVVAFKIYFKAKQPSSLKDRVGKNLFA